MKTVRQLLGAKGHTVHAIEPEATVLEMLQTMAAQDVGALVVTEGGALVGLASERDYARKVILHGRFSKDTRVREIMTTQLVTVTSEQTVQECMELMTRHRVRHLPVVENGKLDGVISIGDVVKAIIEDQQDTIEELEGYITGRR